MHIADGIVYIGVNDHELDLFEGQYIIPNGMAYNSYVILDEKVAVMDGVDGNFTDEWLGKLDATLDGRTPDYLIVQHMEPDHSSSLMAFTDKYPETVVVATVGAFNMMQNYFGTKFQGRNMIVKEGQTLSLGAKELTFIMAPNVHWPEVMFTYDAADKVLFSADAFGKFGALDVDEDWDCEARRYYFGIVGKYGPQVQALLKKAAGLDIQTICPLHGPVLKGEEIAHVVKQYDTWSSYGVESPGLCIAYTSVYGHTKEAALLLRDELMKRGCPKVAIADLARDDMPETVEDAFRYGTLVLATTTYNNDCFPFMRTFVEHLVERNYQNRKVALIENGTWAPAAAKTIKGLFANSKGITFVEPVVTIRSALNEASRAQIVALADALVK